MTNINAAGGSTIYISENSGVYNYNIDGGSSTSLTFPCTITNQSPVNGFVKVLFTTDLTLLNTDHYFTCGSEKIQFGSSSLKSDGTRPIITIDNVTDYPGFIENGTNVDDGKDNIYVFNLYIKSINNSTLPAGAGWVCHRYFGKNASNNYVINCSSDGIIPNSGGGIVGGNAGNSGSLKIIGCSSTGDIANGGGGIIGSNSGIDSGDVTCKSCWSEGTIDNNAGGIVGSQAANTEIINCYSTGNTIGNSAGGILGTNYGSGCEILSCYSSGEIFNKAGGIIGSLKTATSISVANCYTTGQIKDNAGGIAGDTDDPSLLTIQNCYTVGAAETDGYILANSMIVNGDGLGFINNYSEAENSGLGWSDNHANQALTNIPSPFVGTVWVKTGDDIPYELFNMGYTPYTIDNITDVPALNRVYSTSVPAGGSTIPAIVNNKSYTILQINENSLGTITINSSTGVISTTDSTPLGTYTIYIRNEGSYNITTVLLTVTQPPCFLSTSKILTPTGYKPVSQLKKDDLVTSLFGDVPVKRVLKSRVSNPPKENSPFLVPKDFFGPDVPSEDLWLSGWHRIFFKHNKIQTYIGVAANSVSGLIPLSIEEAMGITGEDDLVYYHLELTDRNNCLIASNLLVESFNQISSAKELDNFIHSE